MALTQSIHLPSLFDKSKCIYTSCYCEENVWQLAKSVQTNHSDVVLNQCFVVFISNAKRAVPLWRQKAGKNQDGFVVWDYHVIFIHSADQEYHVYDLDSNLPFPTDFQTYSQETIQNDDKIPKEFRRFFRVIPAYEFLGKFASNRHHMKNEDGSWLKPPPSYPVIKTDSETHNLHTYIDMDRDNGPGQVFDCKEFVCKFS